MDWSSAHGRGKSRRKRQESPGRMTRREQQQRGFQVHHGGAGTTAAGLKAGRPTTIVPFFGDQPFWGERVHARGLGPSPIPVDQFSLAKLVDAIQIMLNPQVKESADAISKAMENEDGVSGAVKAFHKQLPKKMPQPLPLPTEHGRIDSFFRGVGKVFGCA